MKKKLFLLLCTLLTMIGVQNVKAYTTTDLVNAGWTQVTSSTELDNAYCILIDAGTAYTAGMAVKHDANNTGSLYYQALGAPMSINQMWKLSKSGDNYTIQALNDDCYVNGNGNGWDRSVNTTESTGKFSITLDGGVWHIVSTGSYSPGSTFGPWDGTKTDGSNMGVAINKANNATAVGNGDNAPGFYIYSLPSPQDVTSTYITNPSFEANGASIGEGTTPPNGWTFSVSKNDKAVVSVWDNTNNGTGYGKQVTPADGTYYSQIRIRWEDGLNSGTLSQNSSAKLPVGTYTISMRYKAASSNNTNGTALTFTIKKGSTTLGTANGQVTLSAKRDNTLTLFDDEHAWQTMAVNFELTESANISVETKYTANQNSDAILDDVRLLFIPITSTAIALDKTSLPLKVTEKSELTVSYTPANANTDTEITWTSSDEAVATVANGMVTAVGVGSATITATTANSLSATCDVTVTDVTPAPAPSFYSEIAAGDFYLVNAATGKPLGTIKSGWGTQAGLAEHGIPFTVTVGSGTYTLNSHTYNSATDHFFNGAWVDQPTTNLYITSLGSGKYSISTADGSAFVTANVNDNVVANTAVTASSSLAQWYFVSKANYVSALASATESNPVDATFYIQDPDFSRNHILQLLQNGKSTLNPGSETYLWKYTVSNYHFKGGENGNMCAETYQNGGGKVYQELTGIMNGKYLLKAQAFRSGDGETTLYGNDESVGVAEINAKGEGTVASMSGASASFSAGYYQNQLEVVVTDGTLTIGIENSSSNWACFDNFELYYLGPTSVSKTISAAGWATYSSPYALDLEHATGLTDAYIVTGGAAGVLTKTSVKGGTVPANTGLLLKGDEGTATIPVVASSSTNVEANKLVGVNAATEIAANAGYVLMGSPSLGFYQNANKFTVGANTAYLPSNFDGSGARDFFRLEDDFTGINAVEAAEVKAEGLKDGKFLENGKIIIVKNGVKYGANGQILK